MTTETDHLPTGFRLVYLAEDDNIHVRCIRCGWDQRAGYGSPGALAPVAVEDVALLAAQHYNKCPMVLAALDLQAVMWLALFNDPDAALATINAARDRMQAIIRAALGPTTPPNVTGGTE